MKCSDRNHIHKGIGRKAAAALLAAVLTASLGAASMGHTFIFAAENDAAQPEEAPAAETAAAADVIPAAVPGGEQAEMNKSTIGAAFDEHYRFEAADELAYTTAAAAVLDKPEEGADEIASLEKYEEIHLTGTNALRFWEIEYEGEIAYIDSGLISTDLDEVMQMRESDIRAVEEEAELKASEEAELSAGTQDLAQEWQDAVEENRRHDIAYQTRNPNWDGPVLSRSKGSVYGPTGKETYYNLNMSVCVRNRWRRGFSGEAWVRNDGCKMFGDYIMCTANLGLHPYGSLVESSLGTCIVVDTGGFAAGNPNQLDIAVTW